MRNLILWIALFSSSVNAQQVIDTRPLLTVTGEAVEKAIPDLVIIHYTYKYNISRPTADRSSIPEQDWLKQSFKFVGIADDDITVSFETLKNNPSSYTATKVYIFTLKDTKKYKEALNQLVRLEAGEITAIEFRTSKLDEFKNKARTNAIMTAREKGEIMASALGQSIGKAYTIVDEPAPLVNWYDKYAFENMEHSIMVNDVYIDMPGYISIPAKVRVSFDLK